MAYRRAGVWAAAFLLSLCISAAAGCGSGQTGEGGQAGEGEPPGTGREITLQTLAQGTQCEYGRFDQSATQEGFPECTVIEDDEELQRLLYLAGLQLPDPDIDFDGYLVLAAMQGVKSSAGYAVSISRATQYGGEVRVEVEVVEPEEGAFTAQVMTSPYHLVLAERGDFDPRGEMEFVFVDGNGTVLSKVRAGV